MTDQSVSAVLMFTQDMMLEVIEEGWENLIEMQEQQNYMIRALFSESGRVFLDKEKEDLFEMQRLNQEIIVAVGAHKADIANKLRDMRQGKSKAGAYQGL